MRIDWETWAVPKHFDNSYGTAVITRPESIVVAITTLMTRVVFTYGFGPEHNWLEWKGGITQLGELSESAFRALCDI